MRRRRRQVRHLTPAQFLNSRPVRAYFARLGFESRLRWAFIGAGFDLGKLEHVPEHRLTMAWAATPSTNDTRTVRRIRRELREAFRRESLPEPLVFQESRRAGMKTRVILGVFDRPNRPSR